MNDKAESGKIGMTLKRHWAMLKKIPRYPATITAADLKKKLDADGLIVSERTIQRDLLALSDDFSLLADEDSKPFRWSWQKDAPRLDIPGLDTAEALTLVMVEQHLASLLPPTTMARLQPHFGAAHNALKKLPGKGASRSWPDKIRVIAPTQALIAPAIRDDVQNAVYEALLSERQLAVHYLPRGKDKNKEGTVHPLAIVQRGVVTYLVCTFFSFADLRLLPLHRIGKAEILGEAATRPAGFSVDAEIARGLLGFEASQTARIVVDFLQGAGDHLYETPLKKDQILERLDDDLLRLSAEVPLSRELVWWLLGFGGRVAVREPAELRARIAAEVHAAAEHYR